MIATSALRCTTRTGVAHARGQVSRMHTDTCRMTWLNVSFRREIGRRYYFRLFSYHMYQILVKNKTEEAKNKGRKALGCICYLTLKKKYTYLDHGIFYGSMCQN
jgi:hypothetical protein